MLYPLWNLVFPAWNPREPPVKHRTWLLMRKVILLHLSNFKVTLFFFKKKQYHCLTIQTIMYEKIAIQTIDIMNVPMNHLSHLQKWNLFSALEYNLFFISLERRFCMKLTHSTSFKSEWSLDKNGNQPFLSTIRYSIVQNNEKRSSCEPLE